MLTWPAAAAVAVAVSVAAGRAAASAVCSVVAGHAVAVACDFDSAAAADELVEFADAAAVGAWLVRASSVGVWNYPVFRLDDPALRRRRR